MFASISKFISLCAFKLTKSAVDLETANRLPKKR